jgi:WD40 repeat protein
MEPTTVAGKSGDYRLEGRIGRGGMGIVFKARQSNPKRTVALKMILSGAYADRQKLSRFRTEAEVLAGLQHPNIVQIFEVGEHQGLPYFSMEFVPGGTLTRRLAGTPVPPDQAAQLTETLARAVHAAHLEGIIHRDLKPDNVLLFPSVRQEAVSVSAAPGGPERYEPKIADFGLAKRLDDELERTRSHAVMGTVSYMAPEVAAGGAARATPLADVYSLGAILYECLTGRPPFKAATDHETLRQVVEQEPVSPRRLNPSVPRDLETICLKCLSKTPGQRYASADELGADLGHFRAREPIRARPSGLGERGIKWARRHPAAAALIGMSSLAAAALAALSVGLWYNGELESALGYAKEQRSEAESQRKRFEELEASTHYFRDITLAEQSWRDARVTQTLQLLDQWRPKRPDEPERRSWEWYYLRGLCHTEFRRLETSEAGEFTYLAFHPDNRRIAVADTKSQVHVWDVVNGRKLHTLRDHMSQVYGVAFSPDGRILASGSWDGNVRLWDVAGGRPVQHFRVNAWVRSVAFRPDGKYLAAAAHDGTVSLWDITEGRLVRRFEAHSGIACCVTFSPDGRRFATAGTDCRAKVWDTASCECLSTLIGHAQQVSAVAFSPDGQTLATSSEDYTIKLWDPAAGTLRATLEGHTSWVVRVAFSPDGRWLASASDDMTIRFWDVARRKEAGILRGHEGNYLRGRLQPRRALSRHDGSDEHVHARREHGKSVGLDERPSGVPPPLHWKWRARAQLGLFFGRAPPRLRRKGQGGACLGRQQRTTNARADRPFTRGSLRGLQRQRQAPGFVRRGCHSPNLEPGQRPAATHAY